MVALSGAGAPGGAYLRFTIWMLARYARGCGARSEQNFWERA